MCLVNEQKGNVEYCVNWQKILFSRSKYLNKFVRYQVGFQGGGEVIETVETKLLRYNQKATKGLCSVQCTAKLAGFKAPVTMYVSTR